MIISRECKRQKKGTEVIVDSNSYPWPWVERPMQLAIWTRRDEYWVSSGNLLGDRILWKLSKLYNFL